MPRKLIMTLIISIPFFAFAKSAVNNISRRPQQVGGDIGMKYIRAENLTFRKGDVGTEISFTGKEALNLYEVLPEIENSGDRGFIAQGQKKAIYFECSRPIPDSLPLCTIKISKAFDQNENSRSKWINK